MSNIKLFHSNLKYGSDVARKKGWRKSTCPRQVVKFLLCNPLPAGRQANEAIPDTVGKTSNYGTIST